MARQQKLPREQVSTAQSSQPYDNALKGLMGDHAAEIIPEFLPEAVVVSEQNSEIKRENLRADLVYYVRYENELQVLNMELQTNSDSDMPGRMLRYHVDLHLDHQKPVISVILYLFKTRVPASPYREIGGKRERLTFHYYVVALWKLDAKEYIEKQAFYMYTFLPGMKGANVSLLKEVIDDMKQRYTGEQLARHLARFQTILRRSTMLSEADKQLVEGYMEYYDSLLDSDPYFQKRVDEKADERAAEIVAQKLAKQVTDVEIKALQQVALEAVEEQFPALAAQARKKVVRVKQPDILRLLIKQVYKAPDEETARFLIETLAA